MRSINETVALGLMLWRICTSRKMFQNEWTKDILRECGAAVRIGSEGDQTESNLTAHFPMTEWILDRRMRVASTVIAACVGHAHYTLHTPIY